MKYAYIFILIIQIAWTIFLNIAGLKNSPLNYLYNLGYTLPFILSGYVLFTYFYKYKFKPLTTVSLCIGAIGFAFAQLSWTYYNLIGVEIPYPSVADVFFVIFYFATTIGGIMVMKELKVIYDGWSILEFLVSGLVIFFIIYSFISINSTPSNSFTITTALDFLYPLFDSILITMCLAAIRSEKGHTKPELLLYLFAFLTLTFGDSLFSYQVDHNTYWNGNYVDLLFSFSAVIYGLATLYLPKIIDKPTSSI